MKIFKVRISKWWIPALAILAFLWVPVVHFSDDTSTVLLDEEQQLLGALVSCDGQWRFHAADSVPNNLEMAITAFEDRYFRWHPGVNPGALIRAIWLNARSGEIKSGGSTLSMQVVRLARKNRARTYTEKCIEILLALRLELAKSKDEILTMYVSHAPFGGNVVGMDAAAWRYFGRSAFHLSWSEACLLAVLPNAPSLMHPGKNRELLRTKRNRLLRTLLRRGVIDQETFELSLLEDIPEKPWPIPQTSQHLLQKAATELHGQTVVSTLNGSIQNALNRLVTSHHNNLKHNAIMNLSAMVVEVKTGHIKAYVGNVPGLPPAYSPDVDVIQAPRSSGSTLKPVLFAAMMDEGLLTPYSIIPDIPTHFKGFTPRNFNLEFEGAVPANEALVRSLNVPAVYMLKDYGYPAFHQLLKQCGFSTLNRKADHYGLSLILGGGEVTLFELCKVYTSFAHQLAYPTLGYAQQLTYQNEGEWFDIPVQNLSSASLYIMMETLKELNRPDQMSGWKHFESSQPVAWKTGTSFGFRDAWAIGMTPDFVVGVWAGNADGTGRAGLTGVQSAAPLLFDVFNQLPVSQTWFSPPNEGMTTLMVCAKSGYRSGIQCNETCEIQLPQKGAFSPVCTAHIRVHLDESGQHRVQANCYPLQKMRSETWFHLPPAQAYYYRQKHAGYNRIPGWLQGCQPMEEELLSFILPGNDPYVYVPKDFGGEKGSVIFEVAGGGGRQLFWHMDGNYLGSTTYKHQWAVYPTLGKHTLTVTDEEGNHLNRSFEVRTAQK